MNRLKLIAIYALTFFSLVILLPHNLLASSLHRDSAPELGDKAPDFKLYRLDDKEMKRPVKLSAFEGEMPVVLIFGSYT
ncbi:MAG: hypothetical protein ACUZ8E_14815 [Candidatus Anammoxibacter sp.]